MVMVEEVALSIEIASLEAVRMAEPESDSRPSLVEGSPWVVLTGLACVARAKIHES